MEKLKESTELKSKEYYRDKIVDMIKKIDKLGTLEYLYTFISLFIEKWG